MKKVATITYCFLILQLQNWQFLLLISVLYFHLCVSLLDETSAFVRRTLQTYKIRKSERGMSALKSLHWNQVQSKCYVRLTLHQTTYVEA